MMICNSSASPNSSRNQESEGTRDLSDYYYYPARIRIRIRITESAVLLVLDRDLQLSTWVKPGRVEQLIHTDITEHIIILQIKDDTQTIQPAYTL